MCECACVRICVYFWVMSCTKGWVSCSGILGSMSVSQGVEWGLHWSSRQDWWNRGMFKGGSSCFNCLRSLADSLGLWNVCDLLSRSLTLTLSLSLALLDGRTARGKILRPDCRVSKWSQISQELSQILFTLSQLSLFSRLHRSISITCSLSINRSLCAHLKNIRLCLHACLWFIVFNFG